MPEVEAGAAARVEFDLNSSLKLLPRLKLKLVFLIKRYNEPLNTPRVLQIVRRVGQASIVGFLRFPLHPWRQAQLLSPPVVQEACLSNWVLDKGFRGLEGAPSKLCKSGHVAKPVYFPYKAVDS